MDDDRRQLLARAREVGLLGLGRHHHLRLDDPLPGRLAHWRPAGGHFRPPRACPGYIRRIDVRRTCACRARRFRRDRALARCRSRVPERMPAHGAGADDHGAGAEPGAAGGPAERDHAQRRHAPRRPLPGPACGRAAAGRGFRRRERRAVHERRGSISSAQSGCPPWAPSPEAGGVPATT